MKREPDSPLKFNSISELHRMLNLPKPLHPLVSIVHNCDVSGAVDGLPESMLLNFYKIAYKEGLQGKIKYGQSYYDFDEGGLLFTMPNQLMARADDTSEYDGISLLIHPDFINPYPLGKNIKSFHFFSYAANEALHLSAKEKKVITGLFKNMEAELSLPIDEFSQDVMVAQIELLLHYSNRYYKRQFTTRKASGSNLLEKMETLLADYFNSETALSAGQPTVQYLAEQLHVSPHYLSDSLRSLTGQNAQQHIHDKLIEKAKEFLSVSKMSVAEIAFRLGFEYPQSFNKLFKKKTDQSPLEFREAVYSLYNKRN